MSQLNMSTTNDSITSTGKPWKRADFAFPSEKLAKRLLGAGLVRILDDGTRLSGRIVETEAYCGAIDAGAHCYRGRRTARNESMYAKPGTAYVYFTYGMHHCLNVVAGAVDDPVAVLLRAVEPIEGMERMAALRAAARRASAAPLRQHELCSGPARLCQAFAIDRVLDGHDLAGPRRRLWIEGPVGPPPGRLGNGPRIGLGSAGAWTEKPLRWWLKNNRHVSR